MTGSFSRILTGRMEETFNSRGRVLLLLPWKNTDDIEIEARQLFPDSRTRLVVSGISEGMKKDLGKFRLVALLCAEYLLRGEDFRTDEKALRSLIRMQDSIPCPFIIQTSDSAHPIFAQALQGDILKILYSMLPLREQFRLPPFTRLVDIVFKDGNEARRRKMSREMVALPDPATVLGASDSRIRLCFPRNASLSGRKKRLYSTVTQFASDHNYGAFIHFDVDPL